jgi:uncharacterized protein involved in type VI secretion and phage assembly
MTVVYYRLAEPASAVVLAPGQKNWQSIWAEERASAEAQAAEAQPEPTQQSSSVWAEYEQRWG